MATLKEAIRNRRSKGLDSYKNELDGVKSINRTSNAEVIKMVVETKLEAAKADILNQMEDYVSDVAESLIANRLKGDKGDMGPVGKTGARGAKGEKGERGATGADSTTVGPMGPQGKPGKPGRDGKSGNDGNDGVTTEAPTIEAVMEELRPELEKMMDEVKRGVRQLKQTSQSGGGGGGFGQPTSFSFTGDDAATEFTLSARVAANGLACWAYLNGQWLQPGVHFNITNKTLTTTFTPAAEDTLEGFFIRT